VVDTDISVHARGLLDLVARLLASIGTTHTPRALARAIATTLGTAMPVVALELEVAGGRVLVATSTPRRAR
jgi:hypothetical protein